MSARGKARKRAVDVLYQADLRGEGALDILSAQERMRADDGQTPLNPYSVVIIRGVVAHAPEIDGLLSRHAQGWSLERMPTVDRAILRMACFELLTSTGEVPPAVIIAEAVRLAAELSTDESAGFVNGVLGAISRDLASTAGTDMDVVAVGPEDQA